MSSGKLDILLCILCAIALLAIVGCVSFAFMYFSSSSTQQEANPAEVTEPCGRSECVLSHASVLKKINALADPCTDFYAYSCGNYGNRDYNIASRAISTIKWKELLTKISPSLELTEKSSPTGKFIATFYESCINDKNQVSLDTVFAAMDSIFPGFVLNQAESIMNDVVDLLPKFIDLLQRPEKRVIETPYFKIEPMRTSMNRFTYRLHLPTYINHQYDGNDFFVKALDLDYLEPLMIKALSHQLGRFSSNYWEYHDNPSQNLKTFLSQIIQITRKEHSDDNIKRFPITSFESILKPFSHKYKWKELFDDALKNLPSYVTASEVEVSDDVLSSLRNLQSLWNSTSVYKHVLYEYFWAFHKMTQLIYADHETLVSHILSPETKTEIVINPSEEKLHCVKVISKIHEFHVFASKALRSNHPEMFNQWVQTFNVVANRTISATLELLGAFDQELTEKQIEESKDLVYKLDDILFDNNRPIRQIDYFFHTNMSSKLPSSDENFAINFWNLQNDLSGIQLIDFEASYIYSSATSEFNLELFDLLNYDTLTLSLVLAQVISTTFFDVIEKTSSRNVFDGSTKWEESFMECTKMLQHTNGKRVHKMYPKFTVLSKELFVNKVITSVINQDKQSDFFTSQFPKIFTSAQYYFLTRAQRYCFERLDIEEQPTIQSVQRLLIETMPRNKLFRKEFKCKDEPKIDECMAFL